MDGGAGVPGDRPVATLTVETRHGDARVRLHEPAGPRALLALGHGAGGGVDAPDLLAVTAVAVDAGIAVALVEQPYRVAGRRAPPRAPALDAAWVDVLAEVTRRTGGLPVVVGGRSSGARVACRTAGGAGAAAVLCLAFPLRPASRAGAAARPTRLPELDAVDVPVLVVQGLRDPFGMPPPAPGRTVVTVAGDHALRSDLRAVQDAARTWLATVVPGAAPLVP